MALNLAPAEAAVVTDSTTFTAFSVTYDAEVWGAIQFAREADSFSGTLPVAQFGFGRFFLEPGFALASDSSSGPAALGVSGSFTITAKPGFGVYSAGFQHTGRWSVRGSGTVSVEGSVVNVDGAGTSFFFNRQDAFTEPLLPLSGQDPEVTSGYYFVVGERSSLTKVDELTITYDLRFAASASNPLSAATLFSDPVDEAHLSGSYPATNVVGTGVFVDFERLAPVPEPLAATYFLAGIGIILYLRRRGSFQAA